MKHFRHYYKENNGLACLQAVFAHYHQAVSMGRLRAACSRQGNLTMLDLLRVSRSLGLSAKGFKAGLAFLKKQTEPTILHLVKAQRESCFVVCYGYDSSTNQFLIGDSFASKITHWSAAEVEEVWVSKFLIQFTLNTSEEGTLPPLNYRKPLSQWLIQHSRQGLTLLLVLAAVAGVLEIALGLSLGQTFGESLHFGYGLLFLMLIAGRAGMYYMTNYLLQHQGFHLTELLLQENGSHPWITQSLPTEAKEKTYEKTTLGNELSHQFGMLITHASTLLISTAGMFWFSPELGGIALLTILGGLAVFSYRLSFLQNNASLLNWQVRKATAPTDSNTEYSQILSLRKWFFRIKSNSAKYEILRGMSIVVLMLGFASTGYLLLQQGLVGNAYLIAAGFWYANICHALFRLSSPRLWPQIHARLEQLHLSLQLPPARLVAMPDRKLELHQKTGNA